MISEFSEPAMCLQVPLQCKEISADSLVISTTCMFASFEFIYFFRFSPFPHCANFAVKFPTFSSGFKPEWLISMFFAVSAIVSFDFLTVLHTLESKPEKIKVESSSMIAVLAPPAIRAAAHSEP